MNGSPPNDSSNANFGPGASLVRLTVFGLIAIVLMVTDHRADYLDRVRGFTAAVVYPVYQAVTLPGRLASWAYDTLIDHARLRNRHAQVNRELLEARAELERTESLRQENARLRELLDSAERIRREARIAQLMSVDLDPYRHRVLLDRGTDDGIAAGQPLVDGNGIMGQIERTSLRHAYAMLISDPGHALPVQFNRTNLRTIAYGTGKPDELLLPNVPISADVQAGDLLVTSGMGGRFPAGFPVAVVTAVNTSTDNDFVEVVAQPTAGLDRSREVLVLGSASDVRALAETTTGE